MESIETSKIYKYLSNPDDFTDETLQWMERPDIHTDTTEADTEKSLGRSWDIRHMPEEEKVHEKLPLLPREEFLELLKNDVLPVFLFSHGEFPRKNEHYGVFGEARSYGKISKPSDTYFKVPKDTILINPDIEYRTYHVCSFNDDILGTYYGVNPDLLVGKSTKPHTFDYTRHDEINQLFRSTDPFEKKIGDHMIQIFNHTNYYFAGDPFYNLMLSFEMNEYKTAFEYFLQEPKIPLKMQTTGKGNWGVYIQEDNVLKKIECEELFTSHYQTYLAKPHFTFEIYKTADDTFKINAREPSKNPLKLHIKMTDELGQLISKLSSTLDEPLISYLSREYNIPYTTFRQFTHKFYEKVLRPSIYSIYFRTNGKKIFGYNHEEQWNEIKLFSIYVFFFMFLRPDDRIAYLNDEDVLDYIHTLTSMPMVIEVYKNRYVLMGEDKPAEGIFADETPINEFTLKDFIGKMTPLLKSGYCGVPIKKKIMYFLISCRHNYLPDTSWTEEERKSILVKQEQINSVGNENTKSYKDKSNIFTRTAQQLFSKISDTHIKQMEEGMSMLKLQRNEERKKRIPRIQKTMKHRKKPIQPMIRRTRKQGRREDVLYRSRGRMEEERSERKMEEEERRDESRERSMENKRRRTRKQKRGGKRQRVKRTRKHRKRR
jgi:hypothetical protein